MKSPKLISRQIGNEWTHIEIGSYSGSAVTSYLLGNKVSLLILCLTLLTDSTGYAGATAIDDFDSQIWNKKDLMDRLERPRNV